MNRRAFITAAAIVPLARSVGAGGLEPESEIVLLFGKWQVLHKALNECDDSDESKFRAECIGLNQIEDRIFSLPAKTMKELAVKVKIVGILDEVTDPLTKSIQMDADLVLAA
ncbi:MAG: hypothetical protein COB08_019305 [Rhodobacteraceae bacterium]|nr:hypothetical protein [Paracoccaceae bacterium]